MFLMNITMGLFFTEYRKDITCLCNVITNGLDSVVILIQQTVEAGLHFCES